MTRHVADILRTQFTSDIARPSSSLGSRCLTGGASSSLSRRSFSFRAIMNGLSFALLATGAFAGDRFAPGALLTGHVTDVRDGDTIVVADVPVRLRGVDAPERFNPDGIPNDDGMIAASAMRGLVQGKRVVCRMTGRTNGDRHEGRCELEGWDIGAVMIQSGLARRCPSYDLEGFYISYPVNPELPQAAYCAGVRS